MSSSPSVRSNRARGRSAEPGGGVLEAGIGLHALSQSLYHLFHDRRTDRVSNHLDSIPSSALSEFHSAHPHCKLEFRHLEHPHHVAVFRVRFNESEAIDGGDCPKRTTQRLPSTCSIGAVIDQKERFRYAKVPKTATGARECWF